MSEYLVRHLREWKRRLTQIRDTPHAVAGGVAIGLLCGFTPLFGFKTLTAVLIAWLLRCSMLSAALAVTFHDVLLPIWPVILRWQFQLGVFLISKPHRLPPRLSLMHISYEHLFSFKTLDVLWPTFVGSMVIGTPVSLAAYFLMLKLLERSHKLARRRE